MAKRPGRKSNLSPRVPVTRRMPKMGGLMKEEKEVDGKKRRYWVPNQNFASDAVVKALEAAGWKRGRPSELEDEFALLDLNNDIRSIVVDYLADDQYQKPPRGFRDQARSFHKALTALVAKFPRTDGELAQALNDELDKLDQQEAPDGEFILDNISTLLEAAERILVDEAGRGTDADRAKHLFGKGLACIYKERTGRRPTFWIDSHNHKGDRTVQGNFPDLVRAVNKQIPARYRIVGLESLMRSLDIE